MPIKVTGEDGRVLHDNLADGDALDLAQRVHAATGETVTLTPFAFDDEAGEYVLDPANARLLPTPVEEESVPPTEPEAEPKGKKK